MTNILRIDEMVNNTSDNYGVMIWSDYYDTHQKNHPDLFNDDKISEKMFEELLEGDLLEVPLSAFIGNLKELSNKTGFSISLEIDEKESWIGVHVNGESIYPFVACMTVLKNKNNILRSAIGNDKTITIK